MKKFSPVEAIKFGWDMTIKHFSVWLPFAVVQFAAINISRSSHGGSLGPVLAIIALLLGLSHFVLVPASMRLALKFAGGEEPVLSRDLLPSFWLVVRLVGLMIILGIITVAGFIFLIVPGIIFILQYCFASWVLIDRDLGPIEALSEGKRLAKGSWWQIAGLIALLILINIISSPGLLWGIAVFVTMPVSVMATAYAYKKLRDAAPAEMAPAGMGSSAAPKDHSFLASQEQSG